MVSIIVDTKSFMSDMMNVTNYSLGFLDGIEKAKPAFFKGMAKSTLEALKQFVDTSARMDPSSLHHVYEWYNTGSPKARLFDINYTVNTFGISFNSTFSQSKSIQKASGAKVPFYDKAQIMESGVSVTIVPVKAKTLAFEVDGQTVFTSGPVTISDPGGPNTKGAYESTFNSFFNEYFKQSFLSASGIKKHLEFPKDFATNLRLGQVNGRSTGVSTGYKWLEKAGGLL